MFAAIAENMDYFRPRLNLFIALAPVVRVDNCSSGLIKRMKDNDTFENMMIKMDMLELFPSKGKNRSSVAFMHKLLPEVSNLGVKLLCDDDPREINQISLEAFLAHFPAGSSFKSVKHYKQLLNSKTFEHFDYGKEEN
jgi:lysosomal acid lipase/cholesteryl ester hydrolase